MFRVPCPPRKRRVACIHRMKRKIILKEKRERFITSRIYRKIWHDKNLFRPFRSYSKYLRFKKAESDLNRQFMQRG